MGRGEAARAHDRPRLRLHHPAVGRRDQLRRRPRPRPLPAEHARRCRRRRRLPVRGRRHRGMEAAVRGAPPHPRAARRRPRRRRPHEGRRSSTTTTSSSPGSTSPTGSPARRSPAPRSSPSTPRRASASASCDWRSTASSPTTPAGHRRRAGPPLGRPVLRHPRRGHRRHRDAHRGRRWPSTTRSSSSGPAPAGERHGSAASRPSARDVDSIGPGNRVAVNLVGVARTDVGRGDAVVHPGRWHHTTVVDATLARARRPRPRGEPPRRVARLHRQRRAPGEGAGARIRRRAPRRARARPPPPASLRCPSSPATGSCSARAGGARPSAAARSSTWRRSSPPPVPGPTRRRPASSRERGWVDAEELSRLLGGTGAGRRRRRGRPVGRRARGAGGDPSGAARPSDGGRTARARRGRARRA